jgi:hypothetical protein
MVVAYCSHIVVSCGTVVGLLYVVYEDNIRTAVRTHIHTGKRTINQAHTRVLHGM